MFGVRRHLAAHEAVEDVGLRHEHLVEAEHPHHRHQHDRPADDHVDPSGLEARVVRTLGRRLGGERAEDVFGGGPREPEVVDALRVVLGDPELDRGDGGDGAREPDERRGVGRARHDARERRR